ncbi:MAG: nucleoside phosphorylase [Deltaproteobacteria bacterium]|nr:nucleoside phosphorylase [Deltaproteobacteria bacterium]
MQNGVSGAGPLVQPIALAGTGHGPRMLLASTEADFDALCSATGLSGCAKPLFMSKVAGNGHGFSLAGPVVGAPYAVIILETMIACGVREIVYLGWCGSISENHRIGDVIVPTHGYIDEGTSVHYLMTDEEALPADQADMSVASASHPSEVEAMRLAMALEQEGVKTSRAPVWTTDAPFRETPVKINRFAERGAVAVDMETSALFTVARYRQVSLAAALVVSDELFTGSWNPGFASPAFQDSRTALHKALSAICQGSQTNPS